MWRWDRKKADMAERDKQYDEYEHDAVKRVFGSKSEATSDGCPYRQIRLAIAKMSYCEGYAFDEDMPEQPIKFSDEYYMYGVVDE
jgi:hypothetical protein